MGFDRIVRRHRGALALVVTGIGAVAAFVWLNSGSGDPEPNRLAASTAEHDDGTLTDYVGYYPDSFNAALGFDPARVDRAVADWEATHPDAEVLAREPVWAGPHVIGYNIRYR